MQSSDAELCILQMILTLSNKLYNSLYVSEDIKPQHSEKGLCQCKRNLP